MATADEWSNWTTRKKYNALVWIIGSTLCAVIVFLGERIVNEDSYCKAKRDEDALMYKGIIAEAKQETKDVRAELNEERREHLQRLEKFETIVLGLRKESDSLKNNGK